MDKVTILSTTRNRREFLKKMLDSVLAQDYPAIEHIVFDAASTDGTQEVLKSYEAKYAVKGWTLLWKSEKDSGQAEAMNKGLRLATGDLVCLLNDDDWLCDDVVGKYAAVFKEEPDLGLLYGDNYVYFPETGKEGYIKFEPYTLNDLLNNGYQLPQCAAMFRRSLLEKTGLFDESLHHVAEHDLFIRFFKLGVPTKYIPIPFQYVTEHPGRGTIAMFQSSLFETKKINFRYGASHFSRFYIRYLRDRYAKGFFDFLRDRMPFVYQPLKKVFNRSSSNS